MRDEPAESPADPAFTRVEHRDVKPEMRVGAEVRHSSRLFPGRVIRVFPTGVLVEWYCHRFAGVIWFVPPHTEVRIEDPAELEIVTEGETP
jgi:hypothetical protein